MLSKKVNENIADPKLKVALIITSITNNGPTIYTRYLIKALINYGVNIDLYYFDEGESIEMGLDSKRIKFTELIAFERYDIIHSTGAKPDLYCFFNSKKLKKKWVSSAHNFYREDLIMAHGKIMGSIKARIWYLAIKNVKNMIVSSNEMLQYYKKISVAKRIAVIPYGIEEALDFKKIPSEEFNVLKNLKSKYIIIGAVGVLIKRKGFVQLLKFLQNNEKYAVIIIGEGPERKELERIQIDLGVNDRLMLLGYKTSSISYYQFFDLYALTSYSEGFGIAMIEALSMGIPLICSNLPIYSQYFSNTSVGLYKIDDISDLQRAIYKLSEDLNRFKLESRSLFEKHFSLSSMASGHIKFYSSLNE